jgi:PiT family inorganic phosphate transporter|tara:strand:- start:934 stop:2196 length:1263 start_codon:yes stop_codon:yes gene_type:complete
MTIIAEYGQFFVILAALFGLVMAAGIGMNDVANAMGTSVGSKALTIKQAILVAMLFEFAGAFLAGGQVTSTIRKGIIDPSSLAQTPELLIYGMLASLLAAGIWLLIATRNGWPVSTTHSIVGAIIGFGAVGIGVDAVKWGKVVSIVGSWIVTPLLAGVISYLIFRSVQKLILATDKPLERAKTYVPFYMFLAGFAIALVTFLKGLKHVGLHLSTLEAYGYALLIGIGVALIGIFFIRKLKFDPNADKDFHYTNVEKIFAILMVVTACGMAFAHGSNDVANAIGPLAAIVSIVANNGEIVSKSALPLWILLLGGFGIVAGLAIYGHKVIATIGKGITELTPSRGFAAELSAASTVVIASGTGLPVSTTQTLVGAVLGVGFARGISALNLNVIRTIFMSWVITLPVGAALSILFFFIFKSIF